MDELVQLEDAEPMLYDLNEFAVMPGDDDYDDDEKAVSVYIAINVLLRAYPQVQFMLEQDFKRGYLDAN